MPDLLFAAAALARQLMMPDARRRDAACLPLFAPALRAVTALTTLPRNVLPADCCYAVCRHDDNFALRVMLQLFRRLLPLLILLAPPRELPPAAARCQRC